MPAVTKALIVVDVQNDFCEGGSLPVQGGADVALKITKYMVTNERDYAIVVASADYHLPDSDNGGHFDEWPPHCVIGTEGSRFHPNLLLPLFTPVVLKGRGKPAYSAFEGLTLNGNSLQDVLTRHEVTQVDICGLAYDFCVKATAQDAAKLFKTKVIKRLTASVFPEDDSVTTFTLQNAGVDIDIF